MGCIRQSDDLRHMVLNWFGKCLEANRGGYLFIYAISNATYYMNRFCGPMYRCYTLIMSNTRFVSGNETLYVTFSMG